MTKFDKIFCGFLFAAFIFCFVGLAHATDKTRAQLDTSITTNLASGSNITATELRTVSTDIVTSSYNKADDDISYVSGGLRDLWDIPATKQANYTFTSADGLADGIADYIRFNSSAQLTATIPTNAAQAFPIGDRVPFFNAGDGVLLISATAGVTQNGMLSFSSASKRNGWAIKVDTNEWDVQ